MTPFEFAAELRDRTAPEYIDGRPSMSEHDAMLYKAADMIDTLAGGLRMIAAGDKHLEACEHIARATLAKAAA